MINGETTGDPLESAALKEMRWEVAAKSGNVMSLPATKKKQAGVPLSPAGLSSCLEIRILSRHHFSSKLQRMSTVVRDVANRNFYLVVKGSPEMIRTLLQTKPRGYNKAVKLLSRRRYRVISLVFKPLSDQAEVDAAKDARSVCKDKLIFAGFVAHTCQVQRDTSPCPLLLQTILNTAQCVDCSSSLTYLKLIGNNSIIICNYFIVVDNNGDNKIV
jgi:cation-transporting ATPase 13A1